MALLSIIFGNVNEKILDLCRGYSYLDVFHAHARVKVLQVRNIF